MSRIRAIHSLSLVCLVGLIVLGAILRSYHLNTALWYDEIVTLLGSVRLPLNDILTSFPSNNQHTFYSVLAHLSVSLFGESPWSLRFPAAVFGVLTIPILYRLGIAVTNRYEALLATLILTASYHHIWFSQNARGYTLLLFAVTLNTFILIDWLDRRKTSRLAAYALVAALGSYAHLTMVFVTASHAIVLLGLVLAEWRSKDIAHHWQKLVATFLGAAALTVALYSPMLADLESFFTTQTAANNEVATLSWSIIAALQGLKVGFGTVWVVGAAGIVLIAGASSYFTQRPAIITLFLLPIPVMLIMAVVMNRPIFPRFVFFSMGLVLLILVRGAAVIGAEIARRTTRRIRPENAARAAAALLSVAALASSVDPLAYGYRYPKQAYPQAASFLENVKESGDSVAVIGATAAIPFQDYLGKSWQQIYGSNSLKSLLNEGRSVWVVYTFPAYLKSGLPELWDTLLRECTIEREFEGTVSGGNVVVRRCFYGSDRIALNEVI